MKMLRILGLLALMALLVPMSVYSQEDKPNPTAVAVTETATKGAVEATKTVADKAGEVVKDVTAESKEAVAAAVEKITPSASAKEKILDALLSFLDVGKNALQDGLDLAKDGAVVAGKFASEQIPLVLKELIVIRRFEVTASAFAALALGAVGFIAGRKLWKWVCNPKNKEMSGSEMEALFMVLSVLLQAVSLIVPVLVLLTHLHEWGVVWFAPRIYLIEYTTKLIQSLQG